MSASHGLASGAQQSGTRSGTVTGVVATVAKISDLECPFRRAPQRTPTLARSTLNQAMSGDRPRDATSDRAAKPGIVTLTAAIAATAALSNARPRRAHALSVVLGALVIRGVTPRKLLRSTRTAIPAPSPSRRTPKELEGQSVAVSGGARKGSPRL